MSRFKGRVAIVTGAAGGIGKEIAIRLAAEGGSPVIADLNLDAARKTAEEIKAKHGDAFAVAMNVTDEAQVEKGGHDALDGCCGSIGRYPRMSAATPSRQPVDPVHLSHSANSTGRIP